MSHLNHAARRLLILVALTLVLTALSASALAQEKKKEQVIKAHVVALDQPFMYNRLGAAQPQGMIFALKRDVVPQDCYDNGNDCTKGGRNYTLEAGKVMLRREKRARPITLRVNRGQYLEIHFTNLLDSQPVNSLEPVTRSAGVHLTGLELAGGIDSDATWAGSNPNGFAAPGQSKVYKYYAKEEGSFFLYSAAGDWGGQLQSGLFGAVNVQPEDAEWYRSQVTYDDMRMSAYFAGSTGSGDKITLPGHPNMTITRKLDKDAQPITREVHGEKRQVWTLTTIEPDRQTVKTAPAVVIDERLYTLDGQPLIDYNALYPPGHPRAGTPILNMVEKREGERELVHSDLTAIITGPNAGAFPFSNTSPTFNQNPASPDRRQPYREITINYHESFGTVQAFSQFYDPALSTPLGAGVDNFAINYGSGGIGAEILANRLGVGPMGNKDSVDLKFEEFFLSAWAVGDSAMVVDVPANAPNQVVGNPAQGSQTENDQIINAVGSGGVPPFKPLQKGKKATRAYYPDDPSNVYHSYMRDHVKMRILHGGGGITHVHHLHAHQWLHSPNSDNSHYLDSQMINPGTSYTLEMVYNGSGNRNQTVGDAIFHCHFYPHFAGGMWGMWRIHDVFEMGTEIIKEGPDAGKPKPGPRVWNRALPDGEIEAGTPIPALVPLPTLAMAPIPARVHLAKDGRRACVIPEGQDLKEDCDYRVTSDTLFKNPGYPFFVPGVAGHRAPHPPLDFAWEEEKPGQPKLDEKGEKMLLDGGLPRHLILDGKTVKEFHTRWDFSKDFIAYDKTGKPVDGGALAFQLPEEGTAVEKAAMSAHATRTHPSFQPDGDPGNFTLNGLPPIHGAPYADPAVDDDGNSVQNSRRYQAAAVQMDVVFSKKGWHFPQQRFVTLWEDVKDTTGGERPPQPFFFRANTGETIDFWHTNLVPDYYEMDDFQVRTPTDILGQHIHLVKFDVTSSDGAGNGWNYEDGTFSPDEVRKRIDAINLFGGLYEFDRSSQFINRSRQKRLSVRRYVYDPANPNRGPYTGIFGPVPAGQNWDGNQTTIQRWDTDPLLNNKGEDRTMRTVFTHDHFGPSTHQQAGLYGGLLIEPEGSTWRDPINGSLLYDTSKRRDGGPTSWQANIILPNPLESYREFALEFQDFALAYTPGSPSSKAPPPSASALFNVPPSASAPDYLKKIESKLDEGKVSDELRLAFSQSGVTLSDKATASGRRPQWTVNNPYGAGVSDSYTVKVSSDSATGLQVYNPGQTPGWSSPQFAINPAPPDPNNTVNGAPYPTLISVVPPPGTFSLNYRAEPVPLRVWDPVKNVTPAGRAGDLSFAFSSIERADAQLNVQPVPGTPINPANPNGFKFPPYLGPTVRDEIGCNSEIPGSEVSKVQPCDPFTPVLRAYAGDNIQIRTLVGAHHNPHYFTVQGVKWLKEPSYTNSGYLNNQTMGISEHYEMLFQLPLAGATSGRPFTDFLYQASSAADGVTNGLWGILRAYDKRVDQLQDLPNNDLDVPTKRADIEPPPDAVIRKYRVVATTAAQALPEGSLIYNSRGQVTGTDPMSFTTVIFYLANAPHDVKQLDNGKIPSDLAAAFSKNNIKLSAGASVATEAKGSRWVITNPGATPAESKRYPVLFTNQSFGGPAQRVLSVYDVRKQPIENPYALIYVNAQDLDNCDPQKNPRDCKLKAGAPVEPLILRAAAGEWVQVELINGFKADPLPKPFFATASEPDAVNKLNNGSIPAVLRKAFREHNVPVCQTPNNCQYQITQVAGSCQWSLIRPNSSEPTLYTVLQVGSQLQVFSGNVTTFTQRSAAVSPFAIGPLPSICLQSSPSVGLTPQLVAYDAARSGGTNVGFNATQTVAPGESRTLYWYAGNLSLDGKALKPTPVEFGAINLIPSDPLQQHPKGLIGALIVEPAGSTWSEDASSRASAVIKKADGSVFREFVAIMQDDVALYTGDGNGNPIPNPNFSMSVNYGAEPMSYRYPLQFVSAPAGVTFNSAFTNAAPGTSDSLVGGAAQTPIFTAASGLPVRFRMLHPAGGPAPNGVGGDGEVVTIDGHVWQEEPYTGDSREISDNPLSQWMGTRGQHGPRSHFDVVLGSAGGSKAISGDYLYRSLIALLGGGDMAAGVWGIFKVRDELVTISEAELDESTGRASIKGRYMMKPGLVSAPSVTVYKVTSGDEVKLGSAPIDPAGGTWELQASGLAPGDTIRVEASKQASSTARVRAKGNSVNAKP